jgi:hypothetical protein
MLGTNGELEVYHGNVLSSLAACVQAAAAQSSANGAAEQAFRARHGLPRYMPLGYSHMLGTNGELEV